jgi:phosphoglycolate phosphatase-like HAD superfamily hydrolase
MKIIGFDYDGTIINIEPQKAQAFGELLFLRWGVDSQIASRFWIETGGTQRKYKFDYFYQKRYGCKLAEEKYKEIEKSYSLLLKEKFYPQVKLIPGALEILKFARNNFDVTFVSSGVPTKEINFLVKLNGVSRYFDFILGTDKKYPDKISHFKKTISTYSPNLLIYLADGLEDMIIAKKFEAISIGLTTNHSAVELKAKGANFVCNNLAQALDRCKKLISGSTY